MFYRSKFRLENTFVFAIMLLSMTTASFGVSAKQNRLVPNQVTQTNEKISLLVADHQKIARQIDALQASVGAVQKEIDELSVHQDQFVNRSIVAHRIANGHGR